MTSLKNHTSRVVDISLRNDKHDNSTNLYSLADNGEVRVWDYDSGLPKPFLSNFIIKE